MRTSAYLSLFDDWEILRPAILSMIDRVDEIVVVDGAYRWMLPYFALSGRDPARSVPQVYQVLAEFSTKIRVIDGIWENEVEKRQAGYAACTHRYRYRIDADEIFFFDEPALADFFASGKAVAEMQMPLYMAPGYIRATSERIECQCFLFDAEQISAHQHLSYLWLVLPDAERAGLTPANDNLRHSGPVAFNAHLTQWRPAASALSRARFYVMNHVREHGALAWVTGNSENREKDFAAIFANITPIEFDDVLLGSSIVVSPAPSHFKLRATPLTAAQEQSFIGVYETYISGLRTMNRELTTRARSIGRGEAYMLDATLPDSLPLRDGILTLAFTEAVAVFKVQLSEIFVDRHATVELPQSVTENVARVKVPPLPEGEAPLRRFLAIAVWGTGGSERLRFGVRT